MPLQQGRDFVTYMSYFVQYFRAEPVDHLLMLFRTPGAPMFFGGVDKLGGPVLVDTALNLLFAASLTCLFRAVRSAWCIPAAGVLLGLLSLLPSYNWAWHTVASESLTCAGVALLSAACLGAFRDPSPARWALCGVLVFLLAMIRPSGQLFALLCLAPFFLRGHTLPVRTRLFAAMLIPFLVLSSLWMAHNYVRYGEFTLARGGTALIPAYRVFLWDRIMNQENGPASRELATAVACDLLPRPEYREKQVDLDLFFKSGDSFMFADLIALSDRTWGWDSSYSMLRRAAVEAVAVHPRTYLSGLAGTLWLVFSSSEHDIFGKIRERWPEHPDATAHKKRIGMGDPALPGNTEILNSSSVYWLSSGSGRFPHVDADFLEVRAKEKEYQAKYPWILDAVNSQPWAMKLWIGLAQVSAWFFVLPLLGLLCFFEATPRCSAVRWLFGVSMTILVATYMGTDAVIQFRNPFDPVFVLAALAGIGAVVGFGRGSAPGPRQGAALHPPGR